MTNCPSQLTCSMYVDGALATEAAAEVQRHVEECPSCTELIAQLTAESRLLRRVLAGAQVTVSAPALPHTDRRDSRLCARLVARGMAGDDRLAGPARRRPARAGFD